MLSVRHITHKLRSQSLNEDPNYVNKVRNISNIFINSSRKILHEYCLCLCVRENAGACVKKKKKKRRAGPAKMADGPTESENKERPCETGIEQKKNISVYINNMLHFILMNA